DLACVREWNDSANDYSTISADSVPCVANFAGLIPQTTGKNAERFDFESENQALKLSLFAGFPISTNHIIGVEQGGLNAIGQISSWLDQHGK
ncbi:hypothetical protein OAV62_00620, partial [bacterium]|nr:hypothetical protein [bacterium]